jgi:hypothetical protein
MKKLAFLLAFPILFFLTASSVTAQNKAGINIAARHEEFGRAAEVVGRGGWVVVMACPGDGDKIAKWLTDYPDINLVIRGHFSPNKPDAKLAKAWANTLASILSGLPNPRKVYFVPWNEPNQVDTEDFVSESELKTYVATLTQSLSETGVLDKGVLLLSPMINPSNRSFTNYVKNLGSSFFQQFHGIALSLYDTCNGCGGKYQDPMKSPDLLAEMGVPGKEIYGVESGTANPYWYFNQPPNQSSYLYKFVNNFLSNSPSQVKMFAIPSYDLGGEVGHSWSLFSAPDVTNRLREAPDGVVTRASSIPFTATLNKCSGKQHTYYVTSTTECEECGLGGEPMILAVKDNLICTDFSLTKGTEQYTPVAPTGVLAASSGQTAQGSLDLQEEAVPNFSVMEQNLYLGLNRLLPQALRQNLNLDSTPLKTKLKHYVVDQENPQSPTEIPETEVTLPSWWSRLLGSTKIACGLFNTCEPPQKMAIKVAANIPEPPGWEIACQSGNSAEGNPVNQVLPVHSGFTTPASFITEILESVWRFFEGIWQWVSGTSTKLALINKSRGRLPGGETFNEQSTYLNYAIPQALLPDNKDAPLASEAKFEVEGYQKGEGADKLNYQQEATWKRYCLERCALKPQGVSIQSFDPLCPTCSF